jgi:hypothetical protein
MKKKKELWPEVKSVEPPYKRFLVQWEGHPSAVLGSFDSLAEARAFIKTLRSDRRHYVRADRKIVWPENFKPVAG